MLNRMLRCECEGPPGCRAAEKKPPGLARGGIAPLAQLCITVEMGEWADLDKPSSHIAMRGCHFNENPSLVIKKFGVE